MSSAPGCVSKQLAHMSRPEHTCVKRSIASAMAFCDLRQNEEEWAAGVRIFEYKGQTIEVPTVGHGFVIDAFNS
jgi:hypothetical protein